MCDTSNIKQINFNGIKFFNELFKLCATGKFNLTGLFSESIFFFFAEVSKLGTCISKFYTLSINGGVFQGIKEILINFLQGCYFLVFLKLAQTNCDINFIGIDFLLSDAGYFNKMLSFKYILGGSDQRKNKEGDSN